MSHGRDRAVAHDDHADPAERVAAIDRLIETDGARLRPLLECWLRAGDAFLQEEAMVNLLAKLNIEEHVATALAWLTDASTDPYLAAAAAHSLGRYVHATGASRERIGRALVGTMRSREDSYVQRACYIALLAMRGDLVPFVPNEFNLDMVNPTIVREFE